MILKRSIVLCFGAWIISFAALADLNPALHCEENGGQVKIRTLPDGKTLQLCTWGELTSCGDGVCFRYSECTESDFFYHRCNKGECSKIEIDYVDDQLIPRCVNE